MLRQARAQKLIEAGKVVRLTSSIISQIICGEKVTVESSIGPWSEWLLSIGRKPGTVHNYALYVKDWMVSMDTASKFPGVLTENDINPWVNADGIKFTTRQHRLAIISCYYRFCSGRYSTAAVTNLIEANMEGLTHEQKESTVRVPFTEDEVDALMASLWQRYHELDARPKCRPKHSNGVHEKLEWVRFWIAAVSIARHTGLRIGDVCCLEWASFKNNGTMAVWTGKSDCRVEHAVPVGGSLAQAVSLIQIDDDIYCFPMQREIYLDPARRGNLSLGFIRCCQRIGITGKSFHNLRHYFLSKVVNSGGSLDEAAKLAGHASTTTTEGYVHLTALQPAACLRRTPEDGH